MEGADNFKMMMEILIMIKIKEKVEVEVKELVKNNKN